MYENKSRYDLLLEDYKNKTIILNNLNYNKKELKAD